MAKETSKLAPYFTARNLVALFCGINIVNMLWVGTFPWRHHLIAFNDLGFLEYVLGSNLHGLLMRAPLPEDHNHFSVHLHWIFFLLLPFKLLLGQVTLHAFQCLAIASSALPLYLLANNKRPHDSAFTLLIIAAFFANEFVWRCFFAYHYEVLVIPILLWSFYFFSINRNRAGILFTVLAFGVRDDYAFLIGATSIAFCMFDRKNYKRWLLIGLAGIAWFGLARAVIMPNMYNPNNVHANIIAKNWGAYGGSIPEVILYFITHPFWFLNNLIFNSEFLTFMREGLYLPLGSFYVVGTIAPMTYITTYGTSGLLPYYNSSLMLPYFFMGSITTAAWVLAKLDRWKPLYSRSLLLTLTIAALFHYGNRFLHDTDYYGAKVCFLWSCDSAYGDASREAFIDRNLDKFLSGNQESLALSATLFPRVSWRRHYYELRLWRKVRPCWIAIDYGSDHPGNIGFSKRDELVKNLKKRNRYEKVVDEQQFLLVRDTRCKKIQETH